MNALIAATLAVLLGQSALERARVACEKDFDRCAERDRLEAAAQVEARAARDQRMAQLVDAGVVK